MNSVTNWLKSSVTSSPVINRPSKLNYNIDPDQCYEWLSTYRYSEELEGKKKEPVEQKNYEDLSLPKALDGGWGWAVVFGAFSVSLICDGISYCFGILYAELLDYYKESKSKTSFVGSVFFGVSMTLGPVSSVLTSRYGSRTMTIVGGLTSAFGMFLSMFAPSIDVLFITFGVIVGSGFSFCFNASIVIVSFYFEKRRSLATGIAVCGTGFGTITFAPFMDFLVHRYNLSGLFLILSGVCLNLLVCGMLFRPLQFTKHERQMKMLSKFNKIPFDRGDIEIQDNNSDEENDDTMSLVCVPTFVPDYFKKRSSIILMRALQRGKNPDLTLRRYLSNAVLEINWFPENDVSLRTSPIDKLLKNNWNVTPYYQPAISSFLKEKLNCAAFLLTDLRRLGSVDKGSILIAHGESVRNSIVSYHHSKNQPVHSSAVAKRCASVHFKHEVSHKNYSHKSYRLIKSASENNFTDLKQSLELKRTKVKGFFTHLPLYRSDILFRRRDLISCVVATSCPQLYITDIYGSKRISWVKRLAPRILNSFQSLVDCSLINIPFFCVFLLSNFFYYLWSDVPYMYATDHAIDTGVKRQDATFLVSYIGVANTLGQIFFGIVGDLSVNLLYVYAVSSTLGGVFISLVPLTNSYVLMISCYVLFGFFIAVSYPLTSVLLVRYLGLSRLTKGYGLLMLTQGVANFLGPLVSGFLADHSGNYNSCFYSSGVFYIASGLVMFVVYLPWFR